MLVRAGHQSRYQHGQRQQSRANCTAEPASGGAAAGYNRQEKVVCPARCYRRLLAKADLRSVIPFELCYYQLARPNKSTPGVGDALLWGPQDYAMRAWVQIDQLTGLNLTPGDVINAIQSQNVQ